MPLRPGQRLGHYEIFAALGAGGMGEVYRARDTRLGREVAVKVLPEEFARDPERLARFEREAKAVAALSHPNILAIFDFGEHEGTAYAVTELLEGETLRRRLTAGALPPAKVLDLGTQAASGLAAAHQKGIIHRDIKPENLFVTKDGRLKILDFGLAKSFLWSADDSAPTGSLDRDLVTRDGVILGTLGYLSPEQARGQRADQRSDIFALGVVLYEMVSGRRPFTGGSALETLHAILNKEPEPLSQSGPLVPAGLDRIIHRCLEKEPEARFQSASDLAFNLRELADASRSHPSHEVAPSVPAVPPRRPRALGFAAAALALALVATVGVIVLHLKSSGGAQPGRKAPRIVVLPFENLGPPDDGYFAAGMTDEITSRLANVHGLGVISRASAAAYDLRGKTATQIGKDLGVDYVLEGSVRWEHGADRASRVRITPELVRVSDDTSIWSDRYERVMADVFAIQSEVAQNAVKAMGLTLLAPERAALEAASTTDMKAYDLYLRGLAVAGQSDSEKDIDAAIGLFQEAVDRDPRFAEALAQLARNQLRMTWFYRGRDGDLLLKAKEAARRAVELRPDLAETHDALGWYFYQGDLDYPRALDEFAAARRIQPSNSDVLFGVGCVYRRQARWRAAADAMAAAVEFDPKNAVLLGNTGPTYILARRYADADAILGQAIALSPRWAMPYGQRAWLQVIWHGDAAKAGAMLDAAGQVKGITDDAGILAVRGFMAALGRRDYAGELRRLDAEKRPAIINVNWYLPVPLLRGEVEALANEPEAARRSFDAAREILEKAVRNNPGDSRLLSSLAIAYAGLGRNGDAVREGELACELSPPSKDAWLALYRVADLALVYAMVGKPDLAIARLADLLTGCGEFTPYVFRLDPRLDPLRSNPRFQALLAKYEIPP